MSIHSRYIRNNLAFYDTYRMRLIDAIGADVVKWELDAKDFQDSGGSGTDPRGYITTVVEAGAGTSEAEASDESGVRVELVTAGNDNDGINLQLVGEAFQFASTRDIYFGISLEASDATQSDFLVGLAISDTTLLGGVSDGVYFECLDAGTGISTVTEKDSTETQSDDEGTFADDTAVVLEFYFDGTTVTFFIDGVNVGTSTTNIPDDEALTPSIHFLNGAAGAERMKIHWARAFAIS